MIAILLTGCRSKKVVTSVRSDIERVQQISNTTTENKVEKTEDRQQSKKSETIEHQKENQTDFEVKGKAETGKPIEIYNIENGDTLQAIRVSGNAYVHVLSKASNFDNKKNENVSESIIGKLKEFSENIVEENNIKNRVQEVKQKTKEVEVKGFQAGMWIVFAIIGIAVIIVFFIYKYLKK